MGFGFFQGKCIRWKIENVYTPPCKLRVSTLAETHYDFGGQTFLTQSRRFLDKSNLVIDSRTNSVQYHTAELHTAHINESIPHKFKKKKLINTTYKSDVWS